MSEPGRERRVLGRYVLADAIASGGMATIHLGRLNGPVGFARTVAIKRLHPQYAKDPAFVAAFLDEARLAAKIQHPNVAATLDVVATEGELFLVMEYVDGESLSRLMKRARKAGQVLPPRVVSAVVSSALYGLHAAHEARAEDGELLGLVHRDVSPQNILVGADGLTRVVDFGIAKAERRVQETEAGRIKGKFSYMAPEQVQSRPLDRRADVFSAGVVLWEALTGLRLFEEDPNPLVTMKQVLEAPIEPPSKVLPELPRAIDAVVLRALARSREERFETARDMAVAIEQAIAPALLREVGEWVQRSVGDVLERRSHALQRLQREEPVPDASDSKDELSRALDSDEATSSYANSVALLPEAKKSPLAKPAPSRRALTLAAGIAAGALLFAVLLAVGLGMRERQAPAAPPSAHEPRAAAVQDAASEPDAVTEHDAPVMVQDASLGRELAPLPSAAAPSSAKKRRPPAAPGPNCQPPYWVDAEGFKHYKRECDLGK